MKKDDYKTIENYSGLDDKLNGGDSFEDIFQDQTIMKDIIKREPWRDEWTGMPEYVQEANPPYAAMMIRFATEEDLIEFSKLIDQQVNKTTKSLWHPQLERGLNSAFEYVDVSDE